MLGLFYSIALCVVLPVVIIYIIHYYKNKERNLLYQLYQSALEKGVQLPDNILNRTNVACVKNDYRLMTWGVIVLLLGIGVFLAIYFVATVCGFPQQFSIIAVPLIQVGIGLIVSFILRRRLVKKDEVQA